MWDWQQFSWKSFFPSWKILGFFFSRPLWIKEIWALISFITCCIVRKNTLYTYLNVLREIVIILSLMIWISGLRNACMMGVSCIPRYPAFPLAENGVIAIWNDNDNKTRNRKLTWYFYFMVSFSILSSISPLLLSSLPLFLSTLFRLCLSGRSCRSY